MFCVKDNASNKFLHTEAPYLCSIPPSIIWSGFNCEFMGEHISSLPNFVKLSTFDSTSNLSQQAIVRGPLKSQAQKQTKP